MAKKQIWVTANIVKALTPLGGKLSVESPGGDHDTENIIISLNGSNRRLLGRLYIMGYLPWKSVDTPSNTEIDGIIVSDGEDSGGGLNSSNEDLCILYGRVVSKLRKKGFDVVNNIDDYF